MTESLMTESPMTEPLDFDALPEKMTTQQAADVLTLANGGRTVTPANVRARLARGDFGSFEKRGDDANLIPRAAVRAVYEKTVARRTGRTTAVLKERAEVAPAGPSEAEMAPVERILGLIRAGYEREVAALAARNGDLARHAETLAAALADKEETARREADAHRAQLAATAERTERDIARLRAEKDAEIERMREELQAVGDAQRAQIEAQRRPWWWRIFGG